MATAMGLGSYQARFDLLVGRKQSSSMDTRESAGDVARKELSHYVDLKGTFQPLENVRVNESVTIRSLEHMVAVTDITREIFLLHSVFYNWDWEPSVQLVTLSACSRLHQRGGTRGTRV